MSDVDMIQLLDECMKMSNTEPAREMLFINGVFPTVGELGTICNLMGLQVGDEVRFPRVTAYVP